MAIYSTKINCPIFFKKNIYPPNIFHAQIIIFHILYVIKNEGINNIQSGQQQPIIRVQSIYP